MTADRLDLAAVARLQNDADHAAGRLPSRYVEDVGVLDKVAVLIGENTSGPAVGHRTAQPSATAKQAEGRSHATA